VSATRAEIKVSGVVQGVGYRYYCYQRARSLGLTGWVRNNPDGSVALVAEGDESALKALLDELRIGPPAASVADIRVDWSRATGQYEAFEVALSHRGY
jgi:acylphosphatase